MKSPLWDSEQIVNAVLQQVRFIFQWTFSVIRSMTVCDKDSRFLPLARVAHDKIPDVLTPGVHV